MSSNYSVLLVSFGTVLLLFVSLISVNSQEDATEDATEKPKINVSEMIAARNISTVGVPSCKKMMMIMAKKQLKKFAMCAKELQEEIPDQDEFQKKFQCVVKCLFYRSELIDKDYRLTNASIENFLTKHIPPVYHDIGITLTHDCLLEYENKIDPTDPLCKSYGNFMRCLQDVVSSVSC